MGLSTLAAAFAATEGADFSSGAISASLSVCGAGPAGAIGAGGFWGRASSGKKGCTIRCSDRCTEEGVATGGAGFRSSCSLGALSRGGVAQAGGSGAVPTRLSSWDLASALFGLSFSTRRKQYSRRSAVEQHNPNHNHPCSECGSACTTWPNSAAACAKSPDLAAAIPAWKVSSIDKRVSRLRIYLGIVVLRKIPVFSEKNLMIF